MWMTHFHYVVPFKSLCSERIFQSQTNDMKKYMHWLLAATFQLIEESSIIRLNVEYIIIVSTFKGP